MFARVFFSAIAAGLVAGLLISLLQSLTTTPLIRAAEVYETAAPAEHRHTEAEGHVHDDSHEHGAAPPLLLTVGANVIVGVGYALLLVGCLALHGRPVDGRRGLLWGAAGFVVFVAAPTLGLPPETPGMMAADLAARQMWWLGAAAAAGAGLWLAVFAHIPLAVPLGIAVALVPHLVGAPEAVGNGGAVPPELAARFAVTAIGVGAAFWVVLGWVAGTIYGRFRSPAIDQGGQSRTMVEE